MNEAQWLNMFGDNLASMLYEAKYTQRDLADMTGLSESTISFYIHKQKMPGIRAILKIAYALDCEVSELIDFGTPIE